MAELEGRVAIITGGGRGVGREHALLFAAEGAKVVVNDLGEAGEEVAAEIRATGGEAVANADDVTDWEGGRRLVASAVDSFGDLHVLVNNAGILRDRFIVNMGEDEWDDVVRVHLRGHFVPLRFAAELWRKRAKAGTPVRASVINTTSTSGLHANPGQANYGAAKTGIATLTEIAAKELERYGVRVNAIAPAARTRLTMGTPGLSEVMAVPTDDCFDEWDPANVSPFVAWLATERCMVTGRVFYVQGGRIALYRPYERVGEIRRDERWSIGELDDAMEPLLRRGAPVS